MRHRKSRIGRGQSVFFDIQDNFSDISLWLVGVLGLLTRNHSPGLNPMVLYSLKAMNCRDFPENFQDKERFSETGTWKPAGKRGLFFLSPQNALERFLKH